jgi:hypothetical protein
MDRKSDRRSRLFDALALCQSVIYSFQYMLTWFRFDDRRGGESYRPLDRPGRSSHIRCARSPPRNRSPRNRSPRNRSPRNRSPRNRSPRNRSPRNRSPRNRSPRPFADTWVPPNSRTSNRLRSRSPRRRSRSPSFWTREGGAGRYRKPRSPLRRGSPRRDERPRDERPRSPPGSYWRSKSPFGGRIRQTSRDRTPSKWVRDQSPCWNTFRSPRRERMSPPNSENNARHSSPENRRVIHDMGSRNSILTRSGSPLRCGRDHGPFSGKTSRRSTTSPLKGASSTHASAQDSGATSRRSATPGHPESLNRMSLERQTRSPIDQSIILRDESKPSAPHPQPPTRSPEGEPSYSHWDESHSEKGQSNSATTKPREASDSNSASQTNSPQASLTSLKSNVRQLSNNPMTNSQNYTSLREAPLPSGPSNGHSRTSTPSRGTNISLLSAPTRPRGGPSFSPREGNRGFSPRTPGAVMRRGHGASAHYGPPTGLRNNFTPSPLSHDFNRQTSYRYGSINSNPIPYPRHQRLTNHLAEMPTILTGGKLLPSILDPAAEKRLFQLEADKVRLLEQISEKQSLKRAELKDWDRLDRESATGALRSELAEGHLQRISEGEDPKKGTAF